MVQNLILLGCIFLCTLFLTVLRGLFNLPKPETKKEKSVRVIFICIAFAALCLNVWLGIRTYQSESKAPYKLDRQQLSLSIKLNCEHCTDSDLDSIKSLPSQFTVNNIYLGSLSLSCDFNRIETPVKISGPRSATRQIYYRSSYFSFHNKTSSYKYLWDLNDENVSLYLPNEFNEIFVTDTAKRRQTAWWSGQLIVEVDKTSIGEGRLNPKETYNDRPNFNFKLVELSEEEVKAKWRY